MSHTPLVRHSFFARSAEVVLVYFRFRPVILSFYYCTATKDATVKLEMYLSPVVLGHDVHILPAGRGKPVAKAEGAMFCVMDENGRKMIEKYLN
jgi:hypothetical protein